jgi:hypothetical protein
MIPEPSPELFLKIINRIHKEQRILAFRKITGFSLVLLISMIAFVPAIKFLISEIENSGFIQFASLAFSDFEIVKIYWQNFALTILETLPALSLALCLAILLTLLQSIKSLSKNIKIIYNYGYK